MTAHIVAADTAARVASFTVAAKSAPRAINGETYSTVLILINNTVTAGFEVISDENVRNEVWHHQDEEYSLESDFGLFGVNSDNGRISLAVDLTMTGSWNLTLLAAGGGVTATQTVAVSTSEANNEAPTPSTTRFSVRFNAVANNSIFTLSAQDAGAGRDGTTITFSLVESTDFILTNASSSAGATASVEIAILDDATNIFDTDEKEIVVTMTVTTIKRSPRKHVRLLADYCFVAASARRPRNLFRETRWPVGGCDRVAARSNLGFGLAFARCQRDIRNRFFQFVHHTSQSRRRFVARYGGIRHRCIRFDFADFGQRARGHRVANRAGVRGSRAAACLCRSDARRRIRREIRF